MSDLSELSRRLGRIDGRGYPAYKSIAGSYRFPGFQLLIDHVQGDPFAAPSRVRIVTSLDELGLPSTVLTSLDRRRAAADWLLRRLAAACRQVRSRRGSGRSGLVAVDEPGQEVLTRTAVVVSEEGVEARLVVGLPAAGRRILGEEAVQLLCEDLPAVAERALRIGPGDPVDLERHIATLEDQVALRGELAERGLVAWVGDGARLPRMSGVSQLPLSEGAVPFTSPATLAVQLEAPHAGRLRGLGIPRGVTLIVGGGYHGKSTLLAALSRGIYDHIPGDGRQLVVTDPTAVKVRAEDGRRVERVDISFFISHLPTGADTRRFSTDNASGSTSQAANILEALEVGARVLLVDEDTSATNFMIRDRRMQLLVAKDAEPITPFVDLVGSLHSRLGVSTVLVMGGSGDYLDVADTVIQMEAFVARDVTARAKQVAAEVPTGRRPEAPGQLEAPGPRVPDPASIDPTRGRGTRIRQRGIDAITFGEEEVDLRAVEQLVSESQTRAVGRLLHRLATHHLDGGVTLPEGIRRVMEEVEREGLDLLSPYPTPVGDLALPRSQELAAAVNRLRSLRVVD